MNKKKTMLRLLGGVLTIAGFGITMLNDWVCEQQQKEEIKEEVDRAISKREKEMES